MTLNDALLPLQDRQRYPGRFFNPATPQYGQPHAASDAVYTEGLAHAWRLAFATGDLSRARKFERAIHLALHNLSELQFSDSDLPMGFGAGAIATQVGSRRTRIDNTQHALDAMWALETAIQEVMGSNETERGRM